MNEGRKEGRRYGHSTLHSSSRVDEEVTRNFLLFAAAQRNNKMILSFSVFFGPHYPWQAAAETEVGERAAF